MADESFEPQEPAPERKRQAERAAVVALLVLELVLALGSARVLLVRAARAEALQKATASQQKIFVAYTHPRSAAADGGAQIQLPGTLLGNRETLVFARTSGYVRSWARDIGARVRAGEVLAEIATPEIEQQTAQARANAHQTELNLELARQTLVRWEALRKDDLVTQQDLEERRSAVEQLGAARTAALAELARLDSLRSFQQVVAPFAGVITHRTVEVGTLVNAGNGGSPQALFALASTDRLRLELFVPQAYAADMRPGLAVEVSQAELQGQRFSGHIARTAGAIDSATRTLQVEVDIANPGDRLLPGSYVQATLPLRRGKVLTVPANTLLFRAEGPRIGVVDANGHVHLAEITVGRDLGKTIEISAGLQPADRVILNPPDSLAEGDQVDASESLPPKETGVAPALPRPAASGAAGAPAVAH